MYPGPLQRFDLTLAGGLAELDIRPLRAALIKGLLESVSEARVNLVNAGLLARQRGLEIVEHQSASAAQYANLITLQSTHGAESHALAGAVTWGEERIVRVDSYRTDFAPVGDILLCRNSDRPGVIGRVGTILGNANVNINHMDVGPLDAAGPNASGEALMILNIETPAPAEALAAIRAVDGIRDAIAVKL